MPQTDGWRLGELDLASRMARDAAVGGNKPMCNIYEYNPHIQEWELSVTLHAKTT